MLLNHYWAKPGVYSFDKTTGVVERAAPAASAPIEPGAVWKQNRRWFALWHDGTSFVFQHKANRWSLDSTITLSVTGKFRRSFKITRQDETLFEIRYWCRGAVFAFIDPTYDSLDEESDDFFVYVTEMWRS